MSQSRQLAAIMFTDIVGFTALMGSDEKKTFDILEKNRQIHKPIIDSYNGRWIKELGDGVMASFNLVSDAVHAAIKIMEVCNAANEYQLCIGIHLAEVVFENDDVFGDGVNIAARIQSAAGPGCIFISESVHRSISNNTDISTRFAKEAILKNVKEPIRMYEVLLPGSEIVTQKEATPVNTNQKFQKAINSKLRIVMILSILVMAIIGFILYQKSSTAIHPIEIAKSIAVLPFVNMSNDAEQEFFSDGISEEIINKLAQSAGLQVKGRTSSFAFKGKNMDLKLIGAQLNVSYILEGSVRKAGNILRITAQLIKVSDGNHLYSQTFDKELKDIFTIQDEISLAILNAVKIKLNGAEKDIVLKKYTDNVEAYELYLKGRYQIHKFTPDGFLKAIEYLDAAIAIDSTYAIAFADKSFCYSNLASFGWQTGEKVKSQALEAAHRAIQLDDEIAESHLAIGRMKLHWDWKIKEAKMSFEKALAINPNSAEVHVQLAFCAALLGKNKEAIEHASKAHNLDPFSILNLAYLGIIYWTVGDAEKTLAIGKSLVDIAPTFPMGHTWVGAYNIIIKRYDAAIPHFEMAAKLNPDISNLCDLGCIYGAAGEKTKAREIIEKMKKTAGADIAGNFFIGRVYGSIGEWDTAFQYFDKAIENRESRILFIKFDFRDGQMDMNDPRVLKLLEKMGQPYE